MKNQENLNQNEQTQQNLKNEQLSEQQQSQPQSELKEQNLQTQQNLNEQESRQSQSELQSKQQHEPQHDQENEQSKQQHDQESDQQNLKDEPQQEASQENPKEQNLQKALTQKELQNHIKDKLYNTKQENLLTFLSKHYPEAFSENHINLDSLKRILGLETQARGYELNFTGKPLANALYTRACDKELRFDFSFSPYDSKTNHTQAHTIIRGDNLDALKILKQAYSNKIKMIYIDPPYNTKNENFIYPDDFRKDFKEILKETGLLEIVINDKGEEEERESEHLKFFRNITGSKSHSGWLSFMLPRLKLARDLLKEDGVIFISIDDNEQANLKLLCDEIFGEENFVACMPRVTKKAGKSTKQIANNHDYVLCYSKNSTSFKQIDVDESDYKEKDEFFDERGGYKLNQTLDYDSLSYSKNGDYEIILNGKKYYAGGSYENFLKRQSGNFNKLDWAWRWRKDKLEFGLKNGFVEVRNDRIYTKTYFKCRITDKKPYKIEYIDRTKNIASIELIDNKYSNDYANKNLQQIFGLKNIFDYSKSIELLKFLIYQSTAGGGELSSHSLDSKATKQESNKATILSQQDIILDFFAGSGTTAQAVMELNAEDNGNRKFILVQIDEEIVESKSKAAFDFCKNELKSNEPVISDITIERVKRASIKLKEAYPLERLALGFSVFSLVEKSRLEDDDDKLRLFYSNISKKDRARNLSLLDEKPKMLHTELTELIKDSLYQCENSIYVASLNDEVLDYLRNTKDEKVYINGFEIDNLEAYKNLESMLDTRLLIVY